MTARHRVWIRVIEVSLLCLPGGTAAAGPTPTHQAQREVLPEGVVPKHYELALAPDAEALSFSGTVSISIDVSAPTSSVTVNAAGLTFDHAPIDAGPAPRAPFDANLGRPP